jgi:hypothetical protein
MKHMLTVFFAGALFALGLGLSGMTDANKVIGFLNLAGEWDPSLAFVMVGAIGVHLALFKFILHRKSPIFGSHFQIPIKGKLDKRLIIGSAMFGIGWATGGFCPGPGLVSSVGMGSEALVFSASMLFGMVLFQIFGQAAAPAANAALKESATG